MDLNVIKITNIWTKLRFRQWFDTCHLTDLTRDTILMWHVAWIILKKKIKKKKKKIQKNSKNSKKFKKMWSWHVTHI